jgi:molecular chaperone Hsp33
MGSDDLNTAPPPESRLHTFIDEPRAFALYFLEGQRLIHDLAVIHPIHGPGFAYFRDVVLSVQPMIALLKPGEQLGFYLDCDRPPFRLKIEAAYHGATRCTLLPEGFREFPHAMHGVVRQLKLFPGNRPPYESVLRIDGAPLRDVVNRVLGESYQVHSAVLVSQASDQSLMLHQMPPLPGEDWEIDALQKRSDELEARVDGVFARALHGTEDLRAAFEEIGFTWIASRPVRFECSCSADRFIQGIRLAVEDYETLFEPDEEHLELVCEYCKSRYHVSRTDLERAGNPIN